MADEQLLMEESEQNLLYEDVGGGASGDADNVEFSSHDVEELLGPDEDDGMAEEQPEQGGGSTEEGTEAGGGGGATNVSDIKTIYTTSYRGGGYRGKITKGPNCELPKAIL